MSTELANLSEVPFDAPDLLGTLELNSADLSRFDDLRFGLVTMRTDGIVVGYNRVEASFAGLTLERVLGLNFFSDVAPCTNNYLIAGRYEDDGALDDTIDYVFTLRMKPTKVRVRLLKGARSALQFLAVKWA